MTRPRNHTGAGGQWLTPKGEAARAALLAALDTELALQAAGDEARGDRRPVRSIDVIRRAGRSSGCFYQYFPNLRAAMRALAQDYQAGGRAAPDYLVLALAQAAARQSAAAEPDFELAAAAAAANGSTITEIGALLGVSVERARALVSAGRAKHAKAATPTVKDTTK